MPLHLQVLQKFSDIFLDQSNPFNFKLNTFASYIKVCVDAVTNINNAYLDY